MAVHPRSLAIDEPRPKRPEWYCSECRRRVDGPDHAAECRAEAS